MAHEVDPSSTSSEDEEESEDEDEEDEEVEELSNEELGRRNDELGKQSIKLLKIYSKLKAKYDASLLRIEELESTSVELNAFHANDTSERASLISQIRYLSTLNEELLAQKSSLDSRNNLS